MTWASKSSDPMVHIHKTVKALEGKQLQLRLMGSGEWEASYGNPKAPPNVAPLDALMAYPVDCKARPCIPDGNRNLARGNMDLYRPVEILEEQWACSLNQGQNYPVTEKKSSH